MTAESKLEVLRAVEGAGLPVNQVLSQLGISQSTYYRWRQNFRRRGQVGPIEGETASNDSNPYECLHSAYRPEP